MVFFRNPEIRRQTILYLILTAAVTAAGWFYSSVCGLLLFFTCLLFSAAHFFQTYARYRRIAALSRKLDLLLHGAENIRFSGYREGELAVLENELNKMTLRLREQTRLLKKEKVFLEDSIADISHQLKTPLTAMNLVLTLLEDENLGKTQRIAYIRELEDHISHIDWLVATLLKISRIDGGTVQFKKEQAAMEKLIALAAAPLEIPMELKEQQLEILISPEAVFSGDLSWTAEAVRNILKNCMEHTPKGGKIRIEAEENPVCCQISIEDNGRGIHPEDLPHIFERFYKGKDSGDTSVGIGLALARMIITEQEGTLKAENRREGGARFSIRFYKSVI